MKPSEIISEACKKEGDNPEEVLQTIYELIQSGDGKLVQKGNSVLFIRKLDTGVGEIFIFTVDGMMSVVESIKYFNEQLASSGFKTIYIEQINPEILDIMKKIGMPITESDLPKYTWKVQYGTV